MQGFKSVRLILCNIIPIYTWVYQVAFSIQIFNNVCTRTSSPTYVVSSTRILKHFIFTLMIFMKLHYLLTFLLPPILWSKYVQICEINIF
jgi:hypothetical protein